MLMKVRTRPILVGLFLIFSILGTSGFGSSYAINPGSASGLSISPLRQTLDLKPGQASAISITLKNITGGPIVAKAAVRDFESDGVNGNPKIITTPNYTDPASIKNFLVGLGNISLAIGQEKTFDLPVQVPANASPGAYYGLITFQAVPQSTTSSGGNNDVALSAAVSQLVFITVPGNISQSLQLTSVNLYKDKNGTSAGSVVFTKPPKSAGVTLHNYGNAFATPFGTVTVDKGKKQVYSYQLNSGITRGLMLPNSSRTFINAISHIKSPGHYTVSVNASYGSGSDILTAQKSFWYIPTWLIIIVIVILVLILAGIGLLRRKFKKSSGGQKRYKS
jgi:hypothetical protein